MSTDRSAMCNDFVGVQGLACRGQPQNPSQNRVAEGDSPRLLRGLRKMGTVPGGFVRDSYG